MSKLIGNKKTAEYQRVSSGNQDLELQIAANYEYLKDIDEKDILRFIDFDVSATKIVLEERPELNKMLNSIRQGLISRVIVYERDRLARDVYEYINIVKVFYENKIEVIFTATNAPSFSQDLFLETCYGLFAQFEGQRIKTRTSDARKRNPPQIIGYQKINKNGKRIYKAKDEFKSIIVNLFEEFSLINKNQDLYELLLKYKGLLKRDNQRIIEILKNPFFTGHYINSDNSFNLLDHVEPIVPIQLFTKVQEKLDKLEESINTGFCISQQEALIMPHCDICSEIMKFKKGEVGSSSYYQCKKHKKNNISTSELNTQLRKVVIDHSRKISLSDIRNICKKAIKKEIYKTETLHKEKQSLFEDLCVELNKLFTPTSPTRDTIGKFNKLETIRKELEDNEMQLKRLYILEDELKQIVTIVKEKISKKLFDDKSQLDQLVKLLVSNVLIGNESIQVSLYLESFYKEGDESNVS